MQGLSIKRADCGKTQTEVPFAFCAQRIFDDIRDSSIYYPLIEDWFLNRVLPELESGGREIVVHLDQGNVTAYAILKKSAEENKVCRLKVMPEYRTKALGTLLWDHSIRLIQKLPALITVPEEFLPEFSRFLAHRSTQLIKGVPSLYRPGRTEYIFTVSGSTGNFIAASENSSKGSSESFVPITNCLYSTPSA